MKKLYLLALLLVIIPQVNAQNWQWQWVNKYTNLTDPFPQRMIRHNDHLVISGTSASGMFVMVTDTSGAVLWTEMFASSGGAAGTSAITTDNTNIYVSGAFEGTLTAGSTTLTSAGVTDGFIIALDMNGNVLWAQSYGGALEDRITDIIAHNNQLYMLASFENTATFAPQTVTATTPGKNLLLAAFSAANGNLTWHTVKDINFHGDGHVRVSSTGNFIISGNYQGQLNADTISLYYGGPYSAQFLMMLDPAGTALWARDVTNHSPGDGEEMEIDAADSIYLDIKACWTPGCKSYLEKYSHNTSTPAWSETFDTGGYYDNSGIGDIEISGTNIFVTGYAHNAGDYGDPGDDTTQLIVANYNSTGTLVWIDSSVVNDYVEARGIVKGTGNELYVVGTFSDTVTFGNTTLTSPGATAMFIAKIAEPVITGITNTARHDQFDIYPNPSNGTFRINGKMAEGGQTQLFIRNIHGQIVYKEQVNLSAGAFDVHVSTGDLANGMYVMELVGQGTIYRQKLVIEKQ